MCRGGPFDPFCPPPHRRPLEECTAGCIINVLLFVGCKVKVLEWEGRRGLPCRGGPVDPFCPLTVLRSRSESLAAGVVGSAAVCA